PSYRGPSNSRLGEGGGRGGGRGGNIPRGMWHSIGGGESGFATPDPVDPNIIWSTASGSGSVGGIVVRYDESRRQLRDVEGRPDGVVQVTRDGGKNWTNVTKNVPNLPPLGSVGNVEPSRYDVGTAYVTVDFHQVNNRDPFVYKTSDFGASWKSITNGIPHTML